MAERPDAESKADRRTEAAGGSEQGFAAAVKAMVASTIEAQRQTAALARTVSAASQVTWTAWNPPSSITGWNPAGPHDTIVGHAILGGSRTVNQVEIAVHPPEACEGRSMPCCIHRPSKNHMRDWHFVWDADTKTMCRMCDHNCFHPDFDHLCYTRSRFGDEEADKQSIHECDGCCTRVFI